MWMEMDTPEAVFWTAGSNQLAGFCKSQEASPALAIGRTTGTSHRRTPAFGEQPLALLRELGDETVANGVRHLLRMAGRGTLPVCGMSRLTFPPFSSGGRG
jgi:hypothetical protein